ncbi:hypothetical protein C7399_14125 [Paraburkholderia tropica]|uniref:Uncharacterized protein n=1 Tax=Paraburkholderia tropica TaxID=92647 RepID=A0ABX5MFD7_9BURK|nr:hypothetical protein C7400_14125 [Paraburkholderia tropica]PZW70725.1 hypothetical protein C7399_14125 [Paraburkholderia tropica]
MQLLFNVGASPTFRPNIPLPEGGEVIEEGAPGCQRNDKDASRIMAVKRVPDIGYVTLAYGARPCLTLHDDSAPFKRNRLVRLRYVGQRRHDPVAKKIRVGIALVGERGLPHMEHAGLTAQQVARQCFKPSPVNILLPQVNTALKEYLMLHSLPLHHCVPAIVIDRPIALSLQNNYVLAPNRN